MKYKRIKKGDLVKYPVGTHRNEFTPKNIKFGEWYKAEEVGAVGKEDGPWTTFIAIYK